MIVCPHGGPDEQPRSDPRARSPCPGTCQNGAQSVRIRHPPDDPAPGLQARFSSARTDRVPGPRDRPSDRRQNDPGRTRCASKKSYQGSSVICPHCREAASFKEHRDKGFTTLLGDIRVAALGLTGRRMSAGAEEVVTLAGTLTSFGEAATKILPKMAGIRFGEST